MADSDQLIGIFDEAKNRPTEAERQSFITEACAGNPELKEQVLSLLRAHDAAAGFLRPIAPLAPRLVPTQKPGDRIGRYKLLEQIGEGGCGVVYLAEQEEPVRRRVALKIIKLGMDTRQVIARFEAERQALAMMDHPNIAKVFDGGATEAGRPYFVMELVRGVYITRFCDEARLSTPERLRLFVRVCHAIQHAHQKGIIHRDLKPSNILVTVNDGEAVPKVIDFGIAKATGQGLTDKTLFTEFNSFLGTPAYTSPEQAEMSSVDIDTRSDIYSLGVLLYELLTGRPPFDSQQLLRSGLDAMRRTIREQEPARPSTRLGGLGLAEATELSGKRQTHLSALALALRGDLDCIVMKCLEKDRARRYATITGLSMDIERHLNREPVAARSPSRMYLLQKLAQRNKGFLFTAATILVILIGAVLALSLSNLRIRHERNQKDHALAEREAALEAARRSEQRAREQLFVSLQSQAQARRNSRQAGQRLESLAALAEAARIRPTPELRDNAIAAMAIPDVEPGPFWPVLNAQLLDATYDSRYRHYARLEQDGTIIIRSIPEDLELQRLESSPSARSGATENQLKFSLDGRFLARLGEDGKLQVWHWESGESILKSSPEPCSVVAFSPDNRRLAVGHQDWISCFDLGTGAETRRWQAHDRACKLEFHPDSHKIAAGYFRSNLVSIYNTEDGSLLADLPTGSSTMTTVAWHPGGNLLATAGSVPRIQIWDVAAKRELAVLDGHVQQVNFLMFHWSGDLLVSMAWENVLRLWQPLPSRLLMKIPSGFVGPSREGRWSGVIRPDGYKAQLWGIVPSQEYHTFLNTFPEGESTLFEGDISPDGRVLVLGMSDGVRLWEVTRGREIGWLRIGYTTSAVFRADGRELITCGPEDGLRRWPILTNTGPAGAFQTGPFHQIALPFVPMRMSKTGDDRSLGVVSERAGQCVILDLATESVRPTKMPHAMVGYVALTSDAEWLATSGWHSDSVNVWQGSGKLVKVLPMSLASRVFFTPANELIVAHDKEFTFHSLDSLDVSRRLPREIGLYAGYVAFSADGKMMALEMAPGVIHLKEVSSSRTVARLEDPFGEVTSWIGFTPDGTQLVMVAQYAGAIHRWDLRAIRERLKPMGLDWDWPEFPAVVAAKTGLAKDSRR